MAYINQIQVGTNLYDIEDDHVACNLMSSTKAYICGTTSSNASVANSLYFDTGAYLDKDGKITASLFNGPATSAYYADYAEWFPRGEETSEGDIIALDEEAENEQYVKATDKSKCVVGVHSETYGYSVGGEETPDGENYREYQKKKFIPVGLAGRVKVKFIGKAEKGCKVVPSAVAGVGRAFRDGDDVDKVVGYLVESDNLESGMRLLKVKVGK